MAAERTPKIQGFYLTMVYFSLRLNAQRGSASGSAHRCHVGPLMDGCSILTPVSTVTKTEKREADVEKQQLNDSVQK